MTCAQPLHEMQTCLSQSVFEIIYEAGHIIERNTSEFSEAADITSCLNEDGIFNWSQLETFLPESQETPDYYKECANILAPLFLHTQSCYRHLTCEDFKSKFDETLSWISQKQVVFRCFELLKGEGITSAIHTGLLLTPLIERGLGDLVLLKVKQCPSLLRDLLNLDELTSFLSPIVVKFLRILIGPPISLNLRNLLWHGFPSPTEILAQFSYTLLCVIVSIGNLLRENGLMDEMPLRKQFFSVTLPEVFPELPSLRICYIEQVFKESGVILPAVKPLWLLSLQLFTEERYGESVVILLPQLENALRRIYVTVNDCPDRLVTAENNSLFTTFDEILNKYLENGSENQFRTFVGDSYLSMLLDFIAYPLGPRVRDHISHGEVLLSDVPHTTAGHLIWLCYLIAIRFLPERHTHTQDDLDEHIEKLMQEYVSHFHPLSFVKQKVSAVAENLSKWSSIPLPDIASVKSERMFESDLLCSAQSQETSLVLTQQNSVKRAASAFERFLLPDKYTNDADEQLDADFHRILNPMSDCNELVEKRLREMKNCTIYRYQKTPSLLQAAEESRREEELLRILSRVMSILLDASEQIYDVLRLRHDQWKKKELRSRQRNTYTRMLEGIETIGNALRLILFIVFFSILQLDDLASKQKLGALIRFLKKVQKFSENLHSHTNVKCNRWDEAVAYSMDLITTTVSLDAQQQSLDFKC